MKKKVKKEFIKHLKREILDKNNLVDISVENPVVLTHYEGFTPKFQHTGIKTITIVIDSTNAE